MICCKKGLVDLFVDLFKKYFLRLSVYLFFIVSLFSCKKSADSTAPEIAFYHWKNEINLTTAESSYLQDLKAQKLYLRFFDVDWDVDRQAPVPVSEINISSSNLPSIIIPTIFITNRTFLKIKKNDISTLVGNLFLKIKQIQKGIPESPISEIQIDCDWSQNSKENYFYFLSILKNKLKKEKKSLSVTIRLHQLKFPQKTGIPPSDRGALMCYNVGDLQKWETPNSILDDKIISTYLKNNMKYPLPLDIALPVFQWGVLFRDGEMIKLINQLNSFELADQKRYHKKDINRYTVLESTYLHGHYLYPGDQIRLESVSPHTLEIVSQQLNHALPSSNQTLIFYHLDSLTVANYPVTEIKKIQRIFGDVN